ncbi:AraC family transcriptional regulator [Pedobacter chinensis]|uniref:AraC family transcriptional regulator n=1 Tax=Pedobacter chinensis TaxID=2282421 RepID=A0A369PRL8_9SPHI|nr:AraC family transcriptional regulator [Pedobacter chinensis]RDC55173.1 AraC family transcriptional regulator [Pedobacter chinensis]
MMICARDGSTQTMLYKLDLDEGFNLDADIETKLINVNTGNDFKATCKLIYMPGLCFIDERYTSINGNEIVFSVAGNHFLITLISDLNFGHNGQGNGFHLPGEITKAYQSPGDVETRLPAGCEFRRISLVFSGTYILELLKNERWDHKAFLERENNTFRLDGSINVLLNDLSESSYQGIYQRPFFELKLKEFFFKLYAQSGSKMNDDGIPFEIKEKLLAAKAFLTSEFVKPPTIKQLARIVSLNEFKLKLYFKLGFGTTIHNFVTKIRMKEAQRMLNQSLSVTEVSEKIGYKSVSHFIETFKKHHGKTPKQVMKQCDLTKGSHDQPVFI